MRISDWSSDVCSSDLLLLAALQHDQRLALLVAQVLRVDLEMLDDGAQPEPQFVHVVFVVPDDDASLAHDLESDQVPVARSVPTATSSARQPVPMPGGATRSDTFATSATPRIPHLPWSTRAG